MGYITGQHTVLWDGTTVGETDGINMDYVVHKRLITGDNQADTPQDAVHRGVELFLQMTLLEFNLAQVTKAMWPWGATFLDHDLVGKLDVGSFAKAIVLTAVAGTPAAADASADVWTFSTCILAEDFPVSILFTPDLRSIPLRFRVYPSSAGVFGTEA